MTGHTMTPEAAAMLREPFPPETIGKLPKGGVMLDFVGHAAVTDRLLAVDPAWTWEPVAFTSEGLPATDGHGNLWIRLTICGVTRYGVGDGKSDKERIGDAIRNAAMRFGVALDLWSRQDLTGSGGDEQHLAPMTDEETQWVTDLEANLALCDDAAQIDEVAARLRETHPTPSMAARHAVAALLNAAKERVA